MRALITGADGQLARELIATAPPETTLRTVNRAECDITELLVVEDVFKAFRPEIVINTAAYTAVDLAEGNKPLAFRVNAEGAANVAKAAKLVGSRLIHISTDYVFDGRSSTPYPPEAPTNPINVYGASKLQGEKLALAVMPTVTVIRAGWLYSTTGKNFLLTILAALRRSVPLSVVRDQQGCPTSAHEFAAVIWKTQRMALPGVYHWANLGSGSWFDFAREIAKTARRLGLLDEEPEIRAVTTSRYPRPAARPAYSVLDSTKLAGALEISPSSWQEALSSDMTRGREALR